MKKLAGVLSIVLGLLCLPGAYAQYLLTAVSPPSPFTHDDLWNLTVTRSNTQDNYSKFYIALRIYDGQSQLVGQQFVIGQTHPRRALRQQFIGIFRVVCGG